MINVKTALASIVCDIENVVADSAPSDLISRKSSCSGT